MSAPFQAHQPATIQGEPILSLPRRRLAPGASFPPACPPSEPSEPELAPTGNTLIPTGGAIPALNIENERILLHLEARVEERERVVAELESRLRERERDFAEAAALLNAREKVLEATRRSQLSRPVSTISPEEKAAMEALKEELNRHEESILEQRAALSEREKFLDENEAKLFSKIQEHQEKEMQLEQKAEELDAREARVRSLESQVSTSASSGTKSRKWDEFRE